MPDQDTLATFDQLFASAPRRRYKLVTLPVSGLTVRIQSLFEPELSTYLNASLADAGDKRFRRARVEDGTRRLIALCLVDGEGNRMLADGQADKLRAWDSADAQFLGDECSTFVGLKRGEIEDLAKNSEETAAAG